MLSLCRLSLEFGSLDIFTVEDDVLSLFAVSLSELLLQATNPKASVSNNKLEIMRFILISSPSSAILYFPFPAAPQAINT